MADDLQRIIRLDVNATQALAQLDKISRATGSVDKQMQDMSSRIQTGFDKLGGILKTVTAAFATFKSIKAITDAGDQVRQLQGSFEALLDSGERARDMLDEIYSIVANTGVDMGSAAESTQRLAVALGDAGATNAQIAQLAENFVKLGRIGGSSMADISGGLVQFTQALASGKLQGDELKSIMERLPIVGKEIAKEMGVSVGALKQLGADGKITADILVNALLKPTEEVATQFEKLPLTMEQSFNKAVTEGTKVLAQLDAIGGFSKTIAIVFDAIGEALAQISGQTGDVADSMNTWQTIATALGNAFRGVVIVVNTLVGGVGQLLALLKGVAAVGIRAIDPSRWKEIGGVVDDTWQSMKKLGTATMDLNRQIALGESSTKKAVTTTRDWQTGSDKLAAALKKMADEAANAGKKAKGAKPPVDEWNKWLKSLTDAAAELELAPRKLEYLNKQMAEMAESGQASSAAFKVMKKAADELAASLDPVTAAMQDLTKAAEQQAMAPKVIEAIQARMEALAFSGKTATAEFRLLRAEYQKLSESQDDTGATKLVNALVAAERELGNLQAKFDAINKALESGLISDATAEKAKRDLLGVADAASEAADKTKTLAQSVADWGGKVVTDFTDELIDSFGKVESSFGDMVESMLKQLAKLFLNSYFQQFIKAMQSQQGSGGFWGSIASVLASAKGSAFNAQGVQFMAKGGIVNKPTFFAHGGGLGVMGERGAEAIVPLQRTSSGDLGVAAAPVNIQVNNYTSADVQTSETTNVDGTRMIQIEIRKQVKSALSDGSMDRTLRANYGVTRQPVIG